MNKIKCPACGEYILEESQSCSHCGYPLLSELDEVAELSEPEKKEEDSEETKIEKQLGKFNVGAFFLAPYWGFANGLPWLFLIYLILGAVSFFFMFMEYDSRDTIMAACGITGLALSIYLGICGSRLSWNRKAWRDAEHFSSVQKSWAKWSIIILAIILILILILIITFISLLSSIGNIW
ncbi:MAG: zinc ribbon domain-containing protein [Tannerellaceae bacterium]|jgi:hypothetical protein|nr:zinc ribbon domain-containing protein [Tannerellaceae bacterium]